MIWRGKTQLFVKFIIFLQAKNTFSPDSLAKHYMQIFFVVSHCRCHISVYPIHHDIIEKIVQLKHFGNPSVIQIPIAHIGRSWKFL